MYNLWSYIVQSYCDAMMIHRIFKITLKFSLRTFFFVKGKKGGKFCEDPYVDLFVLFFPRNKLS